MTRQTTQHRGRVLGIVGVALTAGLSLGVLADSALAGKNGSNNGSSGRATALAGRQQGARTGQRTMDRTGVTHMDRSGDSVRRDQSAVTAPASATLTDVLVRAVAEERLAMTTYEAVIDAFGAVPPFVNIAESEARHLASLERLADRYGVDVSNIVVVASTAPATLQDAYRLGVQLETEDGALYDELDAALATAGETAQYPDVLRVFDNLQAASLEHHLPTLEAYVS